MAQLSGIDRSQLLLLPEAVDDYVGPDNPVRFNKQVFYSHGSSDDCGELSSAQITDRVEHTGPFDLPPGEKYASTRVIKIGPLLIPKSKEGCEIGHAA